MSELKVQILDLDGSANAIENWVISHALSNKSPYSGASFWVVNSYEDIIREEYDVLIIGGSSSHWHPLDGGDYTDNEDVLASYVTREYCTAVRLAKMPAFGICGGFQLLAISGYTKCAVEVTETSGSKRIDMDDYSFNCYVDHHCVVLNQNNGIRLDKFKETLLVDVEDNFGNPLEVVYGTYAHTIHGPYNNWAGVQWHPEWCLNHLTNESSIMAWQLMMYLIEENNE